MHILLYNCPRHLFRRAPPDPCRGGGASAKEIHVITKVRPAFLFVAATLALGVLIPPGAFAQSTLFNDDFGPKPLGSWQASPLGLLANWDASSGAAVYNGGG